MIADRDSQLKRVTRALEARGKALEAAQAALAKARCAPPPASPLAPPTPAAAPGGQLAALLLQQGPPQQRAMVHIRDARCRVEAGTEQPHPHTHGVLSMQATAGRMLRKSPACGRLRRMRWQNCSERAAPLMMRERRPMMRGRRRSRTGTAPPAWRPCASSWPPRLIAAFSVVI